MTLLQKLVRRPRSTLLWRVNFQFHLWAGLLLTLYLVVIGVSGSILVFRVELERVWGVRAWPRRELPRSSMTMEEVVSGVRGAYPGVRVLSVTVPTRDEPYFVTSVQGRGRRVAVRTDPESRALLPAPKRQRCWLDFVADLHTTLLAGRYGRVSNGIGAVLLLLINGTGLVVWWSGVKRWARGLMIDWRRNWRRINYDAHRAAGFWAIGVLSFWAISGIYFAWPREVTASVNRLSPLVTAQPPVVHLTPSKPFASPAPDLDMLVENARRADPGTALAAIYFPYSRRAPFEISMRRADAPGREYTDIVYLDPRDGSVLQAWRYGVNQSLGDWFVWLQVPLHFGTYWGPGFKALWALLGLTVPWLAITGALMYWNRVLRHSRPR